jgi:hypothetical protein
LVLNHAEIGPDHAMTVRVRRPATGDRRQAEQAAPSFTIWVGAAGAHEGKSPKTPGAPHAATQPLRAGPRVRSRFACAEAVTPSNQESRHPAGSALTC